MAKVIEFYVPYRLPGRRLWNPAERPGTVIEFPSVVRGDMEAAAALKKAMVGRAKKPG